jgi:hypothetical protein
MSTVSHDSHGFFEYNMGFGDIIIRYTAMILIGIVGGLTHQLWLMVLVMPVFIFAVTGWCPINAVLGRNTATKE